MCSRKQEVGIFRKQGGGKVFSRKHKSVRVCVWGEGVGFKYHSLNFEKIIGFLLCTERFEK